MTTAEATHPAAGGPTAGDRLRFLVRTVFGRVLVEPVRTGRMRDVGWPVGLEAVVLAGLLAYAVGLVVVLTAAPLRAVSRLTLTTGFVVGLPRGLVWLLIVLVVVAISLFFTAALHGPWWLRVLALLCTVLLLGTWGLRILGGAGGTSSLLIGAGAGIWTGGCMVGLLVLALVRRRRAFAWWEFCVVLGLVGSGIVAGLVGMAVSSVSLGFDFAPVLLQQTLQTLVYLAIPAAVAAGVSVAEITVTASLAVVRAGRRVVRGRWAYLVLGVVVAIRLVQLGWLAVHADPIRYGPGVFVTTTAVAVGLVVVAVLVLRGRRARPAPVVDPAELPEQVSGLGIPVGAALVLLTLPVIVLLLGLQVALTISPTGPLSRIGPDVVAAFTSADTVSVTRLVIAVGLAGFAVRAARRPAEAGLRGRALLLGCVAVLLVGTAGGFLTGGRAASGIDPDVLNSLATAALLVGAVVTAARRRLGPDRALTVAGALVICALFSSRNFVSDPLGTVIGVSGVGLVLFGLTWDLLTGSGWANGESRRFPRPTRVLILLANAVLTVTVLAFTALGRDPNPGFSLDPYAQLGDYVLGTALLAAAFAALLWVPDDPMSARVEGPAEEAG